MPMLDFLLAIIFVDFLSGIFHWLEDSYGKPSTPLIGKFVTAPNIEHHHNPRKFTQASFLIRNRVTWVITALVICPVIALGMFSPFWAWSGIFGLLSNEIHCWAHRPPSQNPRIVRWLQKLWLVQSPAHHAIHHTDPKNGAYCVITNFLNPVLDGIGFFRGLESIIRSITGASPRPDDSLHGSDASASSSS